MRHGLPHKPKILLLAKCIPQVYIALALLPLLGRRFPQAQISILSSTQHFPHFQAMVDAGLGQLSLRLINDWPAPESSTEFTLVIYLGHSYFLDGDLLAKLVTVSCPIVWLNAHFESADLLRWRRHGPDIASIFQLIFYEDRQDEESLLASGFAKPSLHFVGSAKYDCASASTAQIAQARQNLVCVTGASDNARVMVAASIAEVQEMALLVEAFKTLSARHPQLVLVLAPRSLAQMAEFTAWLAQQPLRFCRSSACQPSTILLLDEVGVLKGYYHCADVAIIGRSFYASSGGGSNLLEPAAAGLPIICGPFMAAFQSIMSDFLQQEALLQLSEPEQLAQCLLNLFDDDAGAAEYGRRAKALVMQGEGVLQRCVDYLAELSQA